MGPHVISYFGLFDYLVLVALIMCTHLIFHIFFKPPGDKK